MNTAPKFIAPAPTQKPRKTLTPDNYPARCHAMVMLGTHTENDFNGNPTTKFKLWLGYEFPTELETFQEDKGPEPYTMGKEFPFSMHEKAGLRLWLESWRGEKFTNEDAEQFDLNKLIGKACSLNVISYKKKNGEDGVKLGGISKPQKGSETPELKSPLQVFSIYEPDWQMFETLPKFLQDKIKTSEEYLEMNQPKYQPAQAESDQERVDNLFKKDSDEPPF